VKTCFDKDWRFHLAEEPTTFWSSWVTREFDDQSWRRLDLPHDWSIELPRDPKSPGGSEGGFFVDGVGWYRKRFTVPESWGDKRVAITFDGVFKNAEIWVNDRYVDRHPYGYSSFTLDLTRYLEVGAENLVAVRVDNSAPKHSRWYSGSGIYRHVWLLVRDPVHVAEGGIFVTTPEVSAGSALVRLETTVVNESDAPKGVTVHWIVRGPEGEECGGGEVEAEIPAGASHAFMQELRLSEPSLWSPDHPSLHGLQVDVRVGDAVVDADSTAFGVRSIEFSATGGFLLNGEPLTMRGGCVHHDCGPLGAMSIDRAEERKVEVLKASGFNAVRCAHNPPAPAFLDACDRLGMLVIDEAFDNWRERSTPNDYHLVFDDWWQRDLDSMVLRDRTHPSIIMWSIGNEVTERGLPWGAEMARRLAERVRLLDPTRPVTSAANSWPDWEQVDAFFAELDVCGYNYLVDRYEEDHRRHPERIIVGTETFASQAYEYWRAAERLPHVVGDFVWTALDYLGEAGIGGSWLEGDEEAPAEDGWLPGWPWHQAFCGDIDICGWKRPPSYYRDLLWHSPDALYIGVHAPVPEGRKVARLGWGWPDVEASWTWPGLEGRELQVDVYSACDEVELLLNGESVGRKAMTNEDRLIATFTTPYAAGELRAVGYRGGAKVAEHSLVTCGPAQSLRLTADRSPIYADPNDLAYITVEAVDAEDRPAPTADHVARFTVTGPGCLAALGSSNPRHTEAYRGDRHRLFRGRCLAIVRPGDQAGEIRLRAEADGLAAAEISIGTGARPEP
jgi:beta-galactosidase